MTHRVGPKGQVVIPKALRDELGIDPGDEVTFWREGDHVAVRPIHSSRPLLGRFPRTRAGEVIAKERRADHRRETRKNP